MMALEEFFKDHLSFNNLWQMSHLCSLLNFIAIKAQNKNKSPTAHSCNYKNN